MICAIDFGSCWIRSVFRTADQPPRLAMFIEKAEYTVVSDTPMHRQALTSQQIPFAECDGQLMVSGNQAARAQWLSRVPAASLLTEGRVPTDDPPARQMLDVLTEAVLPQPDGRTDVCGIILPGLRDDSGIADHTEEFLCRIIQRRGFQPFVVAPAEAALLASARDTAFSGISIVIGGETTSICVARMGVPIASEIMAVGSNWIDAEIARQFRMQMWDEEGTCYLDLEAVRTWKSGGHVHLRRAGSDRERALARLYAVVFDRIVRSVTTLLESAHVRAVLQQQRLMVLLAGGGALVDGAANLLTDRLAEHSVADRILSVRVPPDAATSPVRGALIATELEVRTLSIAGSEAA
jgi:hypothetical protein